MQLALVPWLLLSLMSRWSEWPYLCHGGIMFNWISNLLGMSSDEQRRYLSINDGNQTELVHGPNVESDWLDRVRQKHPWSSFKEYDNRVYEYMEYLLDPAVDESETEQTRKMWSGFTRTQKVFYVLITFDGQVKNGGVYQFLFNYPELVLAALEAFVEIGDKTLEGDYGETLSEFVGKSAKIEELKKIFSDQTRDWDKRWESYAKGHNEFTTMEKIEDYFYTDEFIKSHFMLIADYVETNIHQMARVGK